jgi:hypothetical protein
MAIRIDQGTRFFGASLFVAALLSGCATPTATGNGGLLVGTWKLVSFDMELQATGEHIQPMGRVPTGYLSFMSDGRMAVVITGEGRKAGTSEAERAALFSSLVAYTGNYRVDGDKWITSVDASWNPAWVGTEQPRTYKIAGTQLQESTSWFPRADKTMVRVSNVYERVK